MRATRRAGETNNNYCNYYAGARRVVYCTSPICVKLLLITTYCERTIRFEIENVEASENGRTKTNRIRYCDAHVIFSCFT